ncbi:PIN/TRAM domain-containing protein [Desulfomonile tiedjei]|uniref:Integral membrane protein (PIN domain superfamily) n=1 Tax=Desulfomonile tiedjei (strain ATCC 49306 / DSM 6799 / DCB-1) TaxID=706587 RepID=I4CF24_DESTA|nr:TRAM domain-containing protein [Desulfomonile tiedjei]AFM28165.1 integral membrane protein (PIN domain superfamily) [Desulfomonile tiedjei DSM 6799]
MPSKLLSVVLLTACIGFGGLLGWTLVGDATGTVAYMGAGALLGIAVIRLLRMWIRLDPFSIIGGAVGVISGALASNLITWGIQRNLERLEIGLLIYVTVTMILCLVGLQLGSTKGRELKKKSETGKEKVRDVIGILDTSVVIDGRIADVCETGFLCGDLIIPQFVLKELQMIADSSEATKRTRGRRGLDILNKMQKLSHVVIIIEATDYPSVKEVDQKLIEMAKETGYAIITNDFNLNKVAEVHSIQVLNINQLANALKPVVLPGETMKVQILKEGKEHGQGVAYLDDGTMVVVDNGRRYMGKTVEVTVTSVLQTTAGRMIFAVMKV